MSKYCLWFFRTHSTWIQGKVFILKIELGTLTESDLFGHWGFSSDSSSLLLHPFNILEDISNRWEVDRASICFFEVGRYFSVGKSILSQLGNYRLQFRMNLKNPFSTFTFSSSVSRHSKNTLVTIYLSFPYSTHFEFGNSWVLIKLTYWTKYLSYEWTCGVVYEEGLRVFRTD